MNKEEEMQSWLVTWSWRVVSVSGAINDESNCISATQQTTSADDNKLWSQTKSLQLLQMYTKQIRHE